MLHFESNVENLRANIEGKKKRSIDIYCNRGRDKNNSRNKKKLCAFRKEVLRDLRK